MLATILSVSSQGTPQKCHLPSGPINMAAKNLVCPVTQYLIVSRNRKSWNILVGKD